MVMVLAILHAFPRRWIRQQTTTLAMFLVAILAVRPQKG